MKFYFFAIMVCFVSGCNNKPRSLKISSPKFGEIVSTVETQEKPAIIERSETVTTYSIPAGSRCELVNHNSVKSETPTFITTEPTPVKTVITREKIQTPTAFAPPTPNEIAKASALKWYYGASLFFVLLSVFLFYTQHYKAGIVSTIAAVVVPVLGDFMTSQHALIASVGFLSLASGLFFAWQFVKNRVYSQE